MSPRSLITLALFTTLSLCNPPTAQQPLFKLHSATGFESDPRIINAQKNAPRIFNTIHSSLRQWGSSLQHNGMSFFPAQIPADTLLYHGTHTPTSPTGMEWLAFEVEHAEMFAWSGIRRRPPHDSPGDPPPPPPPPASRHPLNSAGENVRDRIEHNKYEGEYQKGYLHIYKTKKALNRLLYIDGQSAAKSPLGTLDSQDLILRNVTSDATPPRDYARALELCALYPSLEGFIRMEAGFELILCNFTTGVEIVDVVERRKPDQTAGTENGGVSQPRVDGGVNEHEVAQFEHLRALEKRFGGIMAGRINLDYSSIVSAYFHGINLTNPDADFEDLPRLPSSDKEGLEAVRRDLMDVLSGRKELKPNEEYKSINWQGVVDMVVTRYSDRLGFMTSNDTTREMIAAEIKILLDMFIDYSDVDTSKSIEKCAIHYLRPVSPRTRQDHLIHASIATVTNKICTTLFDVRELVSQKDDTLKEAKQSLSELMVYLNWTTWLECGKCKYDEVCYVAIWPWGILEDHEAPACRSMDEVRGRRGYWNMGSIGR